MRYGTWQVIFLKILIYPTARLCTVFWHVLSELGTDNQNSHRQPTPPLNNRCPTTNNRQPTQDNQQPATANDNNDRQSTKRLPTSDPTHNKEQPTVKKYRHRWQTINNQNPTTDNNSYYCYLKCLLGLKDNNSSLTDRLTAIILNSALPILYYLIFIQLLLSYDCCNFASSSSQIEPHNDRRQSQ